MSKIKVVENNGYICKFNPGTHTYTCNGHRLDSVTGVVGSCFPVFDTESISSRYALKWGMSQKQVIKMWQETANHGKLCHSFAETLVLKQKPYPKPKTKRTKIHFKHIYNYIKKLSTKYKFIATEAIFFSPALMLAGTADLILYDPIKKRLLILDWKTNAKMYSKGFDDACGLGDFEHLDDCNLNHYYMQLNIYKGLVVLEEFYNNDLKFNEDEIVMVLLHVTDKGIVPYKVPDLSTEVMTLFNNRLNEIGEMHSEVF